MFYFDINEWYSKFLSGFSRFLLDIKMAMHKANTAKISAIEKTTTVVRPVVFFKLLDVNKCSSANQFQNNMIFFYSNFLYYSNYQIIYNNYIFLIYIEQTCNCWVQCVLTVQCKLLYIISKTIGREISNKNLKQ